MRPRAAATYVSRAPTSLAPEPNSVTSPKWSSRTVWPIRCAGIVHRDRPERSRSFPEQQELLDLAVRRADERCFCRDGLEREEKLGRLHPRSLTDVDHLELDRLAERFQALPGAFELFRREELVVLRAESTAVHRAGLHLPEQFRRRYLRSRTVHLRHMGGPAGL